MYMYDDLKLNGNKVLWIKKIKSLLDQNNRPRARKTLDKSRLHGHRHCRVFSRENIIMLIYFVFLHHVILSLSDCEFATKF